jgi:hypothetical protein
MFRPVTKEVTQVILGRETYFVTTLTEPEAPPLADKQGIFEQYAVDPVKSEAFLGLMSVADIDLAIQGVHAEPQASLPPSAMPFHPHYGLELGATVRLDEQNYAHRCAKCAGVWHSAEAEPERCGKRGCQVGKWRNLKEPFRSMRLEGHLVTPDMIRRAWDQRPRRRKRHQH